MAADSWTNPVSGERQERTEWANIGVWNAAIGEVALDFLKKGSRAIVEGRLETRSWEKDGKKNFATEVVLRPCNGQLTDEVEQCLLRDRTVFRACHALR
jgi:single-strand DNA-binding protein